MVEPIPYYASSNDPSPQGDNVIRRAVAWVIILGSVAFIGGANRRNARRTAAAPAPSTRVSMQVELVGRYAMGVRAISSQSANPDAMQSVLVAQIDKAAQSPLDKIAAAVIAGELLGDKAARDRLDAVRSAFKTQSHAATYSIPEVTYEEVQTIYDNTRSLSSQQREQLIEHLGWVGKLALAHGKPNDDPDRVAVLSAARKTCVILVAVTAGTIGMIVAGVILLIALLVRLADNKLPMHYRPIPGGNSAFLEAFAIYVGGVTLVSLGVVRVPAFLQSSLMMRIALMMAPTGVAIAWPLLCGSGVRNWRNGLGWHAGGGAIREVFLGLVGYIAGAPVMAIGFVIMLFLVNKSGANPTHPIQHMIGGGAKLTAFAFFLASIYAPLTEETMFRGAFFHAMRSRHRWIVSSCVTAFIFAAVHPQGWTAIPVLMSIAIVFAGIREWRGTILASAAAHCVHNTMLLIVVVFLMGS